MPSLSDPVTSCYCHISNRRCLDIDTVYVFMPWGALSWWCCIWWVCCAGDIPTNCHKFVPITLLYISLRFGHASRKRYCYSFCEDRVSPRLVFLVRAIVSRLQSTCCDAGNRIGQCRQYAKRVLCCFQLYNRRTSSCTPALSSGELWSDVDCLVLLAFPDSFYDREIVSRH